MINFYKDVLDGPLYWIVSVISVLMIYIIIRYITTANKSTKYNYEEESPQSNSRRINMSYSSENAIEEQNIQQNSVFHSNLIIPNKDNYNEITNNINHNSAFIPNNNNQQNIGTTTNLTSNNDDAEFL